MHCRHERNVGACHVGDAVRPDTAGDDHVFGFDRALVGDHAGDAGHAGNWIFFGQHFEYFGVGEHLEAGGLHGLFAHDGAGLE